MILIIDLCYRGNSLSRAEFVGPIERCLRGTGAEPIVRHYTAVSAPDIREANGAILCGAALKDTGFLDHPDIFRWLSTFAHPVLGISSGMRALAAAFGGDTVPCCEIGMVDIQVIAPDPLFAGVTGFPAYELHERAVETPTGFIPLAVSDRCVQAIRHRSLPLYGLSFHPEVRNEWIIEWFVLMVKRTH